MTPTAETIMNIYGDLQIYHCIITITCGSHHVTSVHQTHMEKCGKCGTEIESEAVRTTGSVYHAECFKCEVCK